MEGTKPRNKPQTELEKFKAKYPREEKSTDKNVRLWTNHFGEILRYKSDDPDVIAYMTREGYV